MTLCAFDVKHRRDVEFAAQSIADLRRHNEYAGRVACEAIRRYNDHVEFCNRVIEGNESGLWKWISGTEFDAMTRKMQQAKDELTAAQQEVTKLKAELETKTAVIAEMSIRSKESARQV